MIKRSKNIVKTETVYSSAKGPIPLTVKRSSARRTLTICIDEKGDLSISVPMRTLDREIADFLDEKQKWILAKIAESKKRRAKIESKKFDHGHEFLFLGRKFPIKIIPGCMKRVKIEFRAQCWYITVPVECSDDQIPAKVREALIKWYRREAQEVLGGRLFYYARIIGVEPKQVAIRTQKRIWGICDYRKKSINLNWQIILAPMDVIDYVVVHELCHLIVPNHSKRFWRLVEKYLPDYRMQVEWLKKHTDDMVLPQA